MFSKEAFLALAVLANVQDFRAGVNRLGLRDSVNDFSRNVFELKRDDVDRPHKRVEQLPIRVRAVEFPI